MTKYQDAYDIARRAYLEGYAKGAEHALKENDPRPISKDRTVEEFEAWWAKERPHDRRGT